MPDDAIAAAHQRAVEQTMSDERLLGVLPDDLSRVMLDWVIAQLNQSAADAAGVDDFERTADRIRQQARTVADASADAGDDAAALSARLESLAHHREARPEKREEAAVPSNQNGERPDSEQQAVPSQPTRSGMAQAPPPIGTSLRVSLQRAYDRFRAFLRTGGVR
jgi:hypothetical protein